MKYSNPYIIPFKELVIGKHEYSFDIGNEFFENIEQTEIPSGELKMEMTVYKYTSFLTFKYEIEGDVSIQCDRCLDYYDEDIYCTGNLKVVFEESTETPNDTDIMCLNADDEFIDLTHYIYESILLSLPVQKMHPEDERGKSLCNKEMLKILKKHSVDQKQIINDPRWDELKRLKNLN